ncbi:MAG: uncharacterized protein A8A55_2427 [Amphiamblys sp. WSBS2006]|nr:MAG: uncharacterized protein A8A55_2427 [Amphiamblys sp. WSBS2006]
MVIETTETLKLGNIFFVFTDQNLFVVPQRECERIRQTEEGYVCLERKYLPEIKSRDIERVTCIVCHGDSAPEEFITPFCRLMHSVVCKECIQHLRERTNKRRIFCPYCKREQGGNVYQEEILAAALSLIPHQTLRSLELRPDMEVETVTRLTRETQIVLSDIAISNVLFFKLLSRTAVEIKNIISLVGNDNSLDWRIGERDWRTYERIRFCFDEYTSQEMKQVYENTKTMPRKSIQINTGEIHAKENGVYFLLKAWAGANEHSPNIFLKTTKKEHIEEFLEEENSSLWVGR